MYNFKDTTDHSTPVRVLPTEAMMINGVYLENVIPQYRTLYTKGREALSPEIELGEVGVRDGAYLKNRRFPARVITIGYQIVASTPAEFNNAYQLLNDYLDVTEAEIIFADETDKYLTGTPSGYEEIPTGSLSVKSEFTITCEDPFKYSTTEYMVAPTADNYTTFVVDYQGTYPAYPVLQADMYKSQTKGDTNGNCGFVAFATQNADVIQVGTVADPDEVNQTVQELVDETTTTYTKEKTLINESFNTLSQWTTNDGYTGSIYYLAGGTASVGFINSGTDKAVYVSDYGSGSQWHGSTIKKTIPSDGGNPAVTGAKNWNLHGTMRFATSSTAKTAEKQSGRVTIAVLNSNGVAIAGIVVSKKKGSSKGNISFLVNNKTVKTYKNVDLTYYNKYFGFKKAKKKKAPCNYDIVKKGKKFTFKAGGKTFSYTKSSLADTIAKSVSMYIGQWGEQPAVSWMAIYSCKFTSTSVTQTKTTQTWQELTVDLEQTNTFTTNDVVVCDCSDGSIRLLNAYATEEVDGGLHPELGALGNDWETFYLTQGTNQISTAYSDWVTSTYKPTFTLRYRERFL